MTNASNNIVDTPRNKTALIWDLPTRLCHWSMVIAVVYAWISIEILEDMQQHFYAGYTVLTLLLFRIGWGIVGSYYSRFRRLCFPLSETIAYTKHFFMGITQSTEARRYLGHNPLGSLSAVVILAILLLQVSLGLFSTDDYEFGPLSGLVSEQVRSQLTQLHHDNVNVIYAMLALHIIAIAYYHVVKKSNLTRAMITGNKEGAASKLNRISSPWLALLVLALCAGFVYWLATAFVDQIPQGDLYY